VTAPAAPATGIGRPSGREAALLLAILALAAILRLPGLDQRGAWDADQGTDMLVLQGLVDHGDVPLLGPKTSIGTFHHGAVYYYLLAPAAFLSGANPVAVTGEIALFGLGAVAATWWLARLLAGPVAGLAAALLMAVSSAGIEASTFIWNPNLIPFSSAIAFAAALHAVRSRHARWWLLSALGAMVVMQCHVLGVVVVPPLVVAWLVDVRGRRRRDERLGPAVGAGVGGLAIVAAGYVPLLAYELQHDFAETRAILGYLTGGGSGAASGALARIGIVGLRSVAWPSAGLLSDRPLLAFATVLIAVGLGVVAVVVGRRQGRLGAAWLAGSIAWAIVALALFAPSLAVITPGLPNDHYHSFLDPLVLALAGAGLACVAGLAGGVAGEARSSATASSGKTAPSATAGRALAAGLAIALIAISVSAWPPATSPDGGWRLVAEATDRTAASLDAADGPVAVVGIPSFKNANAMRFPLEHAGVAVQDVPDPASASNVVIVCDPLFDDVVGAACGGPAEDAWIAASAPGATLLDRFEAGARRVLSVYAPAP
jgi:4-amino-4-deoxy-L-arabinose transferase-like glycosyltransferase